MVTYSKYSIPVQNWPWTCSTWSQRWLPYIAKLEMIKIHHLVSHTVSMKDALPPCSLYIFFDSPVKHIPVNGCQVLAFHSKTLKDLVKLID